MIHHITRTDTSGELLVQRWQNGVKLIRPHSSLTDSDYSVANLLKLPFNICFMDTESALQSISETCAQTCQMPSTTTFIGKNAFAFAPARWAAQLLRNDQSVLHTNIIKIFHEHAQFPNDESCLLEFISVKSPWYDDANQLVGIFNFAIALGKQELDSGLALISRLGLLNDNMLAPTFGTVIDNVTFSQREIQCLKLYARGKTAKMIAKTLGLSHRTVEHYLENIKRKWHVSSKSELVEKAMEFLGSDDGSRYSSDKKSNINLFNSSGFSKFKR